MADPKFRSRAGAHAPEITRRPAPAVRCHHSTAADRLVGGLPQHPLTEGRFLERSVGVAVLATSMQCVARCSDAAAPRNSPDRYGSYVDSPYDGVSSRRSKSPASDDVAGLRLAVTLGSGSRDRL